MRKRKGRCFFLSGSRCSIYRVRPLICKFYPFSLNLREKRELRIEFDATCSGIGKGKIRNEKFFEGLVGLAKRELSSR